MSARPSSASEVATELRAPPTFGISTNRAYLILDARGRILSCDATAAELLGHRRSALFGQPISQFIAGFALSQASPSYRTRYFVHLCADPTWQAFTAVAQDGRVSAVELSFSHISAVASLDTILLEVRRPNYRGGGQPAPSSPSPGLPP